MWLPPQQSTNRCMNLINSIGVTSFVNYSGEQLLIQEVALTKTDTEQIVRHSLSPRTLAYLMLPLGTFLFLFHTHSTLLTPSISTCPTESCSQPLKLHSKVAWGLGSLVLHGQTLFRTEWNRVWPRKTKCSLVRRPFFAPYIGANIPTL